jgi:hypothetical protein
MRLILGILLCQAVACGGSTTKASDSDAMSTDSGEDGAVCPPTGSPDADVYMCEAGPAGSVGCSAGQLGDKTSIYPEGCQVLLTRCSTFGQVSCTCQRTPGFDDGGLEFVCPG